MLTLACATALSDAGVVSPVATVHLPAVAPAAQVEKPLAPLKTAENLTKIVHARSRLPRIRPPPRTRATRHLSNASTRGDPGLEV